MTIAELKSKIEELEGKQWDLQLQDKYDTKEYNKIHDELSKCRADLRIITADKVKELNKKLESINETILICEYSDEYNGVVINKLKAERNQIVKELAELQ